MTVLTASPGADIDVVEIEVQVPAGDLIEYNLSKLCTALHVEDPACIAVETNGLRRALITVYKHPPLDDMPAARGEDLVMDARGFITVGRFHDGRPARMRLYVPGSGAQRSCIFGTTGAGKSRSLQLILAAEKRSGIVSWLADLKLGQSCPEAAGQVDWHVFSADRAMDMLRAAFRVAEARMKRYARLGRSHFPINRPDPLLSVTIDEANRLLEEGAPYRDEATAMVRELGRTGRSVGVGIRLAAQAGHLADLGGSDTLRAMLKEGEVCLLRWSSSMMQHLVADGLLPDGVRLAPIPKTSGPPVLRSRFDTFVDDDEENGSTGGMAYLLGSRRPTALMRWFRVGGAEPVDGLDPEIIALYGPGEPHTLEAASHPAGGDAYARRHGSAAPAAAPTSATAVSAVVDTTTAVPLDAYDTPGLTLPMPAPRPGRGAPTISARVLAALADGPLAKAALIDALKADGGPAVSAASIANALTGLKHDKQIRPTDTGAFARADQ